MFEKVLVPLDGSELAECSLSHIKKMAKTGAVGEVVLMNAVVLALPFREINLDDNGISTTFDFNAFRNAHLEKSKKYLSRVQSQLSGNGIKVKTVSIEAESPAHAIVTYAHENGIDTIVITTHGYTGMKKMLFGSVAFRVLHESHVPVLLIRPESCR